MENRQIKFPVAAIFCLLFAGVSFIRYGMFMAQFMSIGYMPPRILARVTVDLLILVGIYLFISIVLFMKKRNLLLLVPIAALVLYILIAVITAFSWVNFVSLLAYMTLLAVAFFACGENIFGANMSKLTQVAKGTFFIPMILLCVENLIYLVNVFKSIQYMNIRSAISQMFASGYLTEFLMLLFLGLWLAFPYKNEPPIEESGITTSVEE